jgi:hypothetical protein
MGSTSESGSHFWSFLVANRLPRVLTAAMVLASASPAMAEEVSRVSATSGTADVSAIAAEPDYLADFTATDSSIVTAETWLANQPTVELETVETNPAIVSLDSNSLDSNVVGDGISAASQEEKLEATPVVGVNDIETGVTANISSEVDSTAGLAQVTSVSDFSDVVPSDWAYQALQNLVETYGCLEGYPDGTYRGQRSLSRFEFAAGLNACMDTLVQLISQGALDPDELAALRQLQEEFAAELATLGGRVDALEADVAELQAQQFSTVTKLRGRVFAHVGGGFAGGPILAEGTSIFNPANSAGQSRFPDGRPIQRLIDADPAVTVGSLAWVNFDTSFTGDDLLKLQLVFGDGTAPANLYGSAGLFNTFGTPFTFQTGSPQPFDVAIRELSYKFPLGDRVTFDIGPRVNWYSYFDNNRYTFFLTGANSFNSSGGTLVNAVDRGAGAVVVWDVADWLDLRVGYLAENTEFLPGPRAAGDPTRGLFGGTNTLTAQVGLRPVNNLNLRLLYTRSSLQANNLGLVGGTNGEPIYGFADDGVGGRLTGGTADTFLVNFDYTPIDWLGLFGRYSYGSTNLLQNGKIGEVNAQSFQVGLAFPDLFSEGALGTVSYLVPFDVTGGRNYLVSGGGDGANQQEVEVSYRYPVSQHIALMPSFYWIMNANNFGSNPDIYIFNLQAQLSF